MLCSLLRKTFSYLISAVNVYRHDRIVVLTSGRSNNAQNRGVDLRAKFTIGEGVDDRYSIRA